MKTYYHAASWRLFVQTANGWIFVTFGVNFSRIYFLPDEFYGRGGTMEKCMASFAENLFAELS